MMHCDFSNGVFEVRSSAWLLAYSTVDVSLAPTLTAIAKAHPGVPVFGCTSFRGVFSPSGFKRGMHVLSANANDGVRAVPVLRAVGSGRARTEARHAAAEIRRAFGPDSPPNCILMHATPGFEERILDGIDDAFEGSPPPVYGGSAADDDMQGGWKVFSGTTIVSEGFVLVGFSSPKRVLGSFVSGYTPTNTRGIVTSASGRMVHTIDNRPAAQVYNEWTYGGIRDQLEGGVVLAATALHPIGRLIDKVGAVPRYLLSHPHQVMGQGTLWFFSEMKEGDELILMLGTASALIERSKQVAGRAMTSEAPGPRVSGAILIYCGGCVSVLSDKTGEVASGFQQQLPETPFVGAATFGEQGCFAGKKAVNRHGNLMCDTLIFEH